MNRKDNESRREIVSTFHELTIKHPGGKRYTYIKQTAYKLGYVLDKKNGSSSHVMRVIREDCK